MSPLESRHAPYLQVQTATTGAAAVAIRRVAGLYSPGIGQWLNGGLAEWPDLFLTGRQAFGEQVDDVAPGSLRVQRVVADAGDRGVVDRWVVEGVQGTAVDH